MKKQFMNNSPQLIKKSWNNSMKRMRKEDLSIQPHKQLQQYQKIYKVINNVIKVLNKENDMNVFIYKQTIQTY